MNAPLVERRALPERIEVKIEPVGRTCRVFKITERGLGELVKHAGKLEAGAMGKGKGGVTSNGRHALLYANWRKTCKQ
jgi:hypothetical protein